MHRFAPLFTTAFAAVVVFALAAVSPAPQAAAPEDPELDNPSPAATAPGGNSPPGEASAPEASASEASGSEASGGEASGVHVPLDPCAFAEYLARLPACLEAKSCEAHDLWRRLIGAPGPRVLAPRETGGAPLRLAGGAPGPAAPMLRLPGGGEPSAAHGAAGNLEAARRVLGETPRTVPPAVPCPTHR